MASTYSPGKAEESNTEWLLGVMGTFCFLSLTAISARVYTRFKLAKSSGWDDYVMLATGVATIGGMICFSIQGRYGLGKHREFIPDDDYRIFSKIGFFQGLISDTGAVALVKISIALSLLRLSRKRWYSITLWALIVFVIAYLIVAWCSCIFYCKPVSGFWDKRNNPKCYDIKLFITFALLNTACNLFTDVAFATLPIPIIWVLQMKLRARIYLIGILSLGYVAVAMGAVKAFYQIRFGGDKNDQFMRPIHFWGFVQLNVGIIAACTPTLRPLLGRMLKLSSTNAYNSNNRYYANASARNERRAPGYVAQSTPSGDFELDDRPYGGLNDVYRANVKASEVRKIPIPFEKTSQNGSEEMILQRNNTNSKRIVRTTEIEIH